MYNNAFHSFGQPAKPSLHVFHYSRLNLVISCSQKQDLMAQAQLLHSFPW